MNVFICLSNNLFANSLQLLLTTEGYQISVVRSVAQLKGNLSSSPLAIICDGGVNLNNVVKELDIQKKSDKNMRAPVIFICGKNEEICVIGDNNFTIFSGILHQDDSYNQLKQCLIEVTNQRIYISPTLTRSIDKEKLLVNLLSPSELRVANLIIEGHNTEQIANKLFNSCETIKNHRKSIRQKLGIKGGKLSLINFMKKTY